MKKRMILSIPDVLKRILEESSEYRGCSQSEIVRTALYEHLKDFLRKDNERGEKNA